VKTVRNYINGEWLESNSRRRLDVTNPATGQVMVKVPSGTSGDVNHAVDAAIKAFPGWRDTPATQRVQFLFRMKQILEDHVDEIAEICTNECGKTFVESKSEMVRAVENIEVACGIPTLIQGGFSENIARGIDEYMIRQPLGVGACITPFNFPVMIPFWFMPYALACGNTYIVKPSEKVPNTMGKIFELFEEVGLPDGVLNLVNGTKVVVDTLLNHPGISAISFVGSSAVAKYVYERASGAGKRVQAQGGAKNGVVIMPDSDMESASRIIADSIFGCAGQRCLATSLVITVGKAYDIFKGRILEIARDRVIGYGMDKEVEMGPVISKESKERIEKSVQTGINQGAELLLDGRNLEIKGFEKGYFIRPTILDNVQPDNEIFDTEIFGPVISLLQVKTLDEAIELVNNSKFGNAASVFTGSGSTARKFRHEVQAGNIGINIGIAAPMAFFPFSGWKDSFFGDLHGQSFHAIEFYTQTKMVIERWHDEWSRKF